MFNSAMQVEEYKNLMQRIDDSIKNVFNILNFITVTSAALIGYGFTSNNQFVFLTPFLILIPGSYLMFSNMSDILYSGAYIKYKIESVNPEIEYETYYFEFRKLREKKDNHKKKYPPILTPIIGASEDSCAFFLTINSLSLLFVSLFLIKSPEITYQMLILVIFLLAITIWLSIKILFAYTSSHEESYLRLFKQIDDELNNHF